MLNFPLSNLDQSQLPQEERHWVSPALRARISHLVRRHVRLFLATTTTMLALAIVYVSLAPRIYTAHAQLFLDPRNPQPIGGEDKEITAALDSPEVESQITILRSGQVLAAVVKSLKLYDDPEFALGNTNDNVLMQQGSEAPNILAAIDSLQARLDVRRVGLSHTLDVYFSCRDSAKAAKIANAVAEAFVADQLAIRSSAAGQGTNWLEERIEQLRQQVNAAVLKAQEFRAKRDYRIQEPHDPAGSPISGMQSPQITLDELESTAATYRKLYESYLQAYTTSVQRQALPASIARVITRASPPLAPSHPRTRIILGVSILLGLLLGYGIALVRDLLDKSVKGSNEVQKAGLNWLGELYGLGRSSIRPTGVESKFEPKRYYFRKQERECTSSRLTLASDEPLSDFSSGMRDLQSQIDFVTKEMMPRHFGVTAANDSLNTAEVTYNLAYLSSLRGQRVLIIDANLHRHTLTSQCAPNTKIGLADVLLGKTNAQDCIVVNLLSGVDLLPAGEQSFDITWTLDGGRLNKQLAQLMSAYDVVIFDLPPTSSHAKVALSIGSVLDAIIIIADFGHTQIPWLSRIATAFHSRSVKFVGVAVAMTN